MSATTPLRGIQILDAVPAAHLIVASPDTHPSVWFGRHCPQLMETAAAHGWAVVRGLPTMAPATFRKCVAALRGELLEHYGDLPALADDDAKPLAGVYGVTPFPPTEVIPFHHEGTHTHAPPSHLAFHCVAPAEQGGQTPVADGGAVLAKLPTEIATELQQRGIIYERRFIPGLDVDWRTYFGTNDASAVAAQCAAQRIEVQWIGEDVLVTKTRRPAVAQHPRSGRRVFFNQILLHHPACLDDEIVEALSLMSPDGLPPRRVLLDASTPVPDDWIAPIVDAYRAVAAAFHWVSGDVMILDNRATAHARLPFRGNRSHYVSLMSLP